MTALPPTMSRLNDCDNLRAGVSLYSLPCYEHDTNKCTNSVVINHLRATTMCHLIYYTTNVLFSFVVLFTSTINIFHTYKSTATYIETHPDENADNFMYILLLLLMVSSSLYISHMSVTTRVLSRLVFRVVLL